MAKTKLVYINDLDVWEFICGLTNFSAWVRDHARKEMQGGIDPGVANYIDELLSRRLGGRVVESVIIPVLNEEFDPEVCGFL